MILLAFVLAGSLMAGAMPVAATSEGSISGHVYRSPEGTAISAATVWLRNYPLFPNYLLTKTVVELDGSYTFSELPTGQYAVWVTTGLRASEWYDGDDGALDSCAAQAVSVTDSDTIISGIDFTLASGGHIQGVVYGPDGSTPIVGAYVVVVDYTVPDKPECFLGAGQTNMNGLYTTSGLPTGQYKVFATAIGYASQWYGNTYNYWAATAVSVTAGSFTTGKNFTLASGGSVSGTVTDDTNPIAGAMVLAYDYGMLSHMKPNVLSTAFTNPDGTYTLNGLAAGQYAIRASASNYTSEYYCNHQHNALATNPVSVTAGSNTPNINFALDLGGGTISGNVTDGTNPIGGAWVGVFDRDSMINHIMVAYDVAFTDASGNYSTVRLPAAANHYAVRVLASGRAAEWWDDKYNINDSSAVTVNDNSNTPGKNFALDVGGTISGNVSDEAAHPIPGAAVVVYAYNSLPTALVGYSVSSTDSAGNYASNGLPAGEYAVWAIAAGYDAEWWQEASAVGDADAVVVTAPGNIPDIDFSLVVLPPAAPTGFNATAVSSSRIDLSWIAGTGAQKTMVRRSGIDYPTTSDAGDEVYFNTETSTSDTGLTPNTIYYYSAWSWVEGSDIWSDTYATAQATTALAPPEAISQAQLQVMPWYRYWTDGNTVANASLEFQLDWVLMFYNNDPAQDIAHLTLSSDASGVGPITATDPTPASVVGSTYTWEFDNVPPSDGGAHWNDPSFPKTAVLSDSLKATMSPGFVSERLVDKEIFSAADNQTVTVKITPDQSYSFIMARVEPESRSGENDLVRWEVLGPCRQITNNPTANQTYTYQFTLSVTPKQGAVRFLPEVAAFRGSGQAYTPPQATNTVSVNAADTLGRTLRSTATTSQLVQAFSATAFYSPTIMYNRVSETAAPISQAWLHVGPQYRYETDNNTVNDVPLAFQRWWDIFFLNKDTTRNIAHLTLSSDATNAGPVIASYPPVTPVNGIYTWNFDNVPPTDEMTSLDDPNAQRYGWLQQDLTVTMAPGFTSTRDVDQEVFSGPGTTQTVTVTVTPTKSYAMVDAWMEPQSRAGGNALVSWEVVGPVRVRFANPNPGQTYTYDFILNVTPQVPGEVKFLPTVSVICVEQGSTSSVAYNTTSVSTQSTDNGYTLTGTATTSEIVQGFVAIKLADIRVVTYNRASALQVPVGSGVAVEDPFTGVSTTFSEVSHSGDLQVNVTDEEPAPTTGFAFLDKYYDISTEASYSGNVTITINYDEADIPAGQLEQDLRLYHWTGSAWEDVTTSVDTVNNKITGQVTSLSWFVVGVDDQPPVVTITLPDTGLGSGVYLLNQVVSATWLATDAASGVVPPDTGTIPIDTSSVGTKTLTVLAGTAVDKAGNPSAQTTAHYSVRYAFGGILQPINVNASSVFKLGSTVPVKFQLRDANGKFVTNAVATISVAKLSGLVWGDELEAVSTSAATTGNLFRSADNQYIFNLNTKPLSAGTWRITITLDDGTSPYVIISFKK
jgi:hypothetical protein